ncbi:MAG: DEAD/DEAH box helicase, partial [Aristaeellaceae bacterium]
MALELYPHQAVAAQAAERMLADKGRAAVILPTGAGKSYIAFRIVEQHPEAAFLWLAPSEYIFRTQTENLRRTNPELSLEKVTFCTYASLIYRTDKELAALPCDYIVLDEFHRCGSEHWGAAVQQLLETHPQAKLLGLSATHIRYLDHQRNMAEELLDNCIAAEMTLGEAIVRGILPAPKYVTTVYQYQKNLARYEERVASQRNQRSRARSERYLQALRRTLEQAEGLDAVFARHMTDKSGRYLVFCAGVEHMREMLAHAGEWFRAVDPEPHCYQVYAENAEASAAYDAFRQDDSDHLKLLFCVNMFNEGVHVEGISGVILFRPTVSPIIYKQQIGRALTAGGSRTPLILDVVNNVEGLYSIDSIGQEMLEAAFRLRSEGQEELIVRERFRIIDQVKDCRKLFEQLEGSLHIGWEEYYQAAKCYREEHGDLLIPRRYVT